MWSLALILNQSVLEKVAVLLSAHPYGTEGSTGIFVEARNDVVTLTASPTASLATPPHLPFMMFCTNDSLISALYRRHQQGRSPMMMSSSPVHSHSSHNMQKHCRDKPITSILSKVSDPGDRTITRIGRQSFPFVYPTLHLLLFFFSQQRAKINVRVMPLVVLRVALGGTGRVCPSEDPPSWTDPQTVSTSGNCSILCTIRGCGGHNGGRTLSQYPWNSVSSLDAHIYSSSLLSTKLCLKFIGWMASHGLWFLTRHSQVYWSERSKNMFCTSQCTLT